MKFSIIIPVFNRPDEIQDLLTSLLSQTYRDFEVIVVEDGSEVTCEAVVSRFSKNFSILYFFQENSGQGFARNFGMAQASGEFFVILDSDVVLPSMYLEVLAQAIRGRNLDAFGGPDRSGEDFSPLQKAMDFAMTSFWTTGGIRGKLKDPSKYQARGFNMGVSRQVFEQTQGFLDPNRGEDIEWSLRIKKSGFRLELVEEAYVFHKRKNTLLNFMKQSFSFGHNRVNVSRFHPGAIQLVHLLPLFFLLFLISIGFAFFLWPQLFYAQLLIFGLWSLGVLVGALIQYRSLLVMGLSWICAVLQLSGYGAGLLYELSVKAIKG